MKDPFNRSRRSKHGLNPISFNQDLICCVYTMQISINIGITETIKEYKKVYKNNAYKI